MKTIKVDFTDFWPGFKKDNNFFIRLLRQKYNVELSNSPDYLIFSCFGTEHLKYDCIKIFFTGEDLTPDFNLCDYAIGFDDIQFGDRYIRFPYFAARSFFAQACPKHLNITNEDIQSKTGFCNFVYSNASANPIRTEFYNKLSKYKPIASGGRYMNNIGGPVDDKIAFQNKFKFSITFENESSLGYTTEKILDAFYAKTIPIYWGNVKIAEDFNPAAFINCHDFSSLDEAIEYVKKVDNDDALYRSILLQPIFKDGKVPYKFSSDAVLDFLTSIIEQPLDRAKRVSKYSFRKNYITNMKRYAEQDKLFSTNLLYRGMKKIIK